MTNTNYRHNSQTACRIAKAAKILPPSTWVRGSSDLQAKALSVSVRPPPFGSALRVDIMQ